MKKNELLELFKKKGYSEGMINDLISLYPYMVKCFGQERVDKFLNEWKYVVINKIGASGATYRDKKEIVLNEYNGDIFWKYRIITAAIHETGHALGMLKIPTDDFFSKGIYNDDFFTKMEEAIVSDYQDDLICGELQYCYIDNICFNKCNFKCRGDLHHLQSYAIEKFYYNIFKIILADKKHLFVDMMYENDLNKKQEIFKEIMLIISQKLSQQQFKCLMDSCAILIYNHGYSSFNIDTKYDVRIQNFREKLYKFNSHFVDSGECSKNELYEDIDKLIGNEYKNVRKYVSDNNISNVDIFEQCDKLSEMTIDFLTMQLEEMQEFDFEVIKSVCCYFTKINNKSKGLVSKTKRLKELLYQHLLKLNFYFNSEMTNKFSDEEIICIIIKLISLTNSSLDMLNSLKIMKSGSNNQNFLYASNGETIIKIGKCTELEKDDLKAYRDVTELGVYVDVVIPQVNLLYNNSIGDPNINEDLKITNNSLCQITLGEKKVKK